MRQLGRVGNLLVSDERTGVLRFASESVSSQYSQPMYYQLTRNIRLAD